MFLILTFVVYYDQKWRVFLGGIKSKRKVGRSVISTLRLRRDLAGCCYGCCLEYYQFALWGRRSGHGQLSLLKLSPSGYSNLNSATSRIVESMPMHGFKIDGKRGWVKSKFSLEQKKLFSPSATFFYLSQPKWPKLQFSAYLVISIRGWVGFFSAIIKSGWHVKSQIRRSSLVSKYIVFWLKKGCGVLGLFCISIVHSLV